MNKVVAGFVLSLTVALAADAQNIFVPKIGLSYNYNTNSIDNFYTSPRPGLLIGFGYNMTMSDHLSFQPEIYYVQKNFNFDVHSTYKNAESGDVTETTTNKSYRMQYLEIPATLKYKLFHDKMFVTLGPYISIALAGHFKLDESTSTNGQTPITAKADESVEFVRQSRSANDRGQIVNRRVDVGIQPGIGYVLPHNLMLELRYDYGLTSMFSVRHSANQTLMLSLSYPLSRKREEE